ncbi:MAG TPA: hypothetical protein VMJ30_10875 [Gemmatimonadales bacterium]|nr:hypothetical protein [Gemmatimonadales bacterium]
MIITRRGLNFALAAGLTIGAALGCAETNPSLPPPVPTLVILDSTHAALQIVPIEAPSGVATLALPGGIASDVGLATRGSQALLTFGGTDTVLLVDLSIPAIIRPIGVPAGSRVGGPAFVDDTTAYVALAARDQLLRIDLRTGDTASVAVGRTPVATIATRGKVFAINADELICGVAPCPSGASWVTVVDPVLNTKVTDMDSIPLVGPGNARAGTVGSDGLIYITQAGTPAQGEGRLSIVDPVGRLEKASFGGLGVSPGPVAADQGDRIVIASLTEGMMLFDLRLREVERGEGEGLPVASNTTVAADGRNYLFGIESRPCSGPQGKVRIFKPDLTEVKGFDAGLCPATVSVTGLPAR